MKYLIFLILISTPAFGGTKEDIQSLIGRYDETAYVTEVLTPNSDFIPLTPGAKSFKATYTIHHSGVLPEEVKTLVEKKAGNPVSYITVQRKEEKKFPDRIIGEFKDLDKLKASIEAISGSISTTFKDKFDSSSKMISDAISASSEKVIKPLLPYILVAAGVIGVFFLLSSLIANGGLKRAADRIAKAFESGSSQAQTIEQDKTETPTAITSIMEDLPSYIYKNALYDLYWSKLDSEAAFIASQMPFSAKVELAKDKVLASYFEYLSDINPEASNCLSDASYLSEKSYNHLSNEDVLKAVKTDSKAYKTLSDIRVSNIQLSVTERIELEKGEKGSFDWTKLGASQNRVLNTIRLVSPGDNEAEVLASLNEEDRKMLLSLYNLAQSEKAAEILSAYTAKQLATIWLGTPEVLSTLEALLPEVKVNMLKAYLEKATPSRNILMKEIVKKAVSK